MSSTGGTGRSVFCFVCRKKLKSAISGKDKVAWGDPPAGGTCWDTPGNLGSDAFDPGGVAKLQICVCDACLLERSDLAVEYRLRSSGFQVGKFEPKRAVPP